MDILFACCKSSEKIDPNFENNVNKANKANKAN